MKAFLLAAGLGTRLRPITTHTPKCLVPIDGRPLLGVWLELLARHEVGDVLINTHHLPDEVRRFVGAWAGKPRIRLSHEPVLLGSAGTLERNWDFVQGEDSFLVCYADNLTDIDLGELMRTHRGHDGALTMGLFEAERPESCGVVELDANGLILSFEEKPFAPRSRLANGGVYVMRTRIRSKLPKKRPADIGFDLLPECLGDMYGWLWKGFLADIGSPEAYERAERAWRERRDGPTIASAQPLAPGALKEY